MIGCMDLIQRSLNRSTDGELPMTRILILTLLVFSFSENAIVVRHDVAGSKYRVQAIAFLALADMPGIMNS